MKFAKMQAAGNDYVYVDYGEVKGGDFSKLSKMLSERSFGIGGDGLIVVEKSGYKSINMRIFNSDGSEGRTCGNGIRCSAFFAKKHLGIAEDEIFVETLSGVSKTEISRYTDKCAFVQADMGVPKLTGGERELCEKLKERGVSVSPNDLFLVNVGNLHAVFFVDEKLEKLAEEIGKTRLFEDGINVERCVVCGEKVRAEVFERGSGRTLACGSGAVAVGYATYLKSGQREIEVIMDGGTLGTAFSGGRASLSGMVNEVFTGEYEI